MRRRNRRSLGLRCRQPPNRSWTQRSWRALHDRHGGGAIRAKSEEASRYCTLNPAQIAKIPAAKRKTRIAKFGGCSGYPRLAGPQPYAVIRNVWIVLLLVSPE